MYIYIIFIIFCILILCILLNTNKPKKKFKKKHKGKKSQKNNTIYIKSLNTEEPYYLTWKYDGNNWHQLKLIPYHNKGGEFVIHNKDANYLKQFYTQYGLYSQDVDNILNNITFITPSFPVNPIQYLELIEYNDNEYIIKKNIFAQYDANYYLHIDNKNTIYFLPTIEEDIGKFVFEYEKNQ